MRPADAIQNVFFTPFRSGAASSHRSAGRGFSRHPAVVRPVEANTAKLEFAFHAPQLRIGDGLDHAFEIAADAAQRGPRVNAVSLQPAKPVAAPRALRSIITEVRQIVVSVVAGGVMSHVRTPLML